MLKYLVLCAMMCNYYHADGKIIGRCELYKELKKNGINHNDAATFVCIANFESGFDSDYFDGGHNFGIFRINGETGSYWCYQGDEIPTACGLACCDLLGDNITNSIQCANTIKVRAGFMSWVTYEHNCNDVANVVAWASCCE